MARVIGGSTIGEGCFLDRDVVIGYPPGDDLPLLDSDREVEIAGAAVGDNCTLRAGTLYSRARLGSGVRSGHGWLVREDSTVGDGCLIGTGVTIDNDCRVGDHCSLQTGVYNINEVRSWEGLAPLPGEEGTKHYVPMNLAPLGDDGLPEE